MLQNIIIKNHKTILYFIKNDYKIFEFYHYNLKILLIKILNEKNCHN